MNRLTIIGNLTADPVLRTTPAGLEVCSFTVAVNRKKNQQQETDFFNVSAWRELGSNCAKYLAKGRKVAVVGSVSVHLYNRKDGTAGANMEVQANEVEFLSSRNETEAPQPERKPEPVKKDAQTGMEEVDEELPF